MIGFAVREGARNFKNMGVTGLLTLVSLTATLTLVGLAAGGYLLLKDWSRGLLGRFEIEAFLLPDVDSTAAAAIAAKITALPDVQSVEYISKERAADRFQAEFGPGIIDLLEFNPLPPSIVVTLKEGSDPSVSWDRASRAIETLAGVDDVVYEGDLLVDVQRFYARAGKILGIAVAATLTLSLFFTILSVLNAIRARADFIRLISLAGGTRGMARGPFMMMGVYYGVFAGLCAVGVLYALSWLVQAAWNLNPIPGMTWMAGLVGLGILIGALGAGWAAGRRIRK